MIKKTSSEAISSRIKALREKHNETQKDLAEALKSTQNNVWKMEHGESLTIENLIEISKYYDVSLDYLCKGEGGIDLIDTLEKYIHYRIPKTSSLNYNAKDVHIPQIDINTSLFQYLRQKALATKTLDMPKDIREQWIEQAKDTFINELDKDNYNDYRSFYLIDTSLLVNNGDIASQLEILLSE